MELFFIKCPEQAIQDNSAADRDIKRMFCADLRNFYTAVGMFYDGIINAGDLITKDYGYWRFKIVVKIIEGGTAFGLFN
jgi:hypothetical protein